MSADRCRFCNARLGAAMECSKCGSPVVDDGEVKGNCPKCSWTALSVEVVKEMAGGGGAGKTNAPADPIALARELWTEGVASGTVEFCSWDDATPGQKLAAYGIALYVLKHFTRKAWR
jgi:hypothetical protein